MPGLKSKRTASGKWKGWYKDHTGKQKWITFECDKSTALAQLKQLENNADMIRAGLHPAPKPSDAPRDFADTVAEYIDWGKAQGGIKGRPWSKAHTNNKAAQLEWWRVTLNFTTLHAMKDCLPRVEKALRSITRDGHGGTGKKDGPLSGKTLANYAESLRGFVRWCCDRSYLEADPLKCMAPYDTTPTSTRRALTQDEVDRLLAVCPPDRRLVYELALSTGLRANEIRSLERKHMIIERDADGAIVAARLALEAKWTKNRKADVIPIHPALAQRLEENYVSNPPALRYAQNKKACSRTKAKGKSIPLPKGDWLIYINSHQDRRFRLDIKEANIQPTAPGGRVDFHSLRNTYITTVIEYGANIKEAQAAARHSTPNLTMNVYARCRTSRLDELNRKISESITPPEKGEEDRRAN